MSLSILISGGKEINKDFFSNGEWIGKSLVWKLDVFGVWIVVWRSVFSDGLGLSFLERGVREGESFVVFGFCCIMRCCLWVGLFGNVVLIGW